jgi:hypothetical protein
MTLHQPCSRAVRGVILLVACGLAACGRVPGQFEIVQNQVPLDDCSVDTNASIYRGDGTLDLSLVQAGARAAYMVYPLVRNNLPGATGSGPDGNQIDVNSFAVDIGPSSFGALPPNVAALFETLDRAPRNSADYALLHYSIPWAASIGSGGGLLASRVAAFPIALAARIAATGDVGVSRTSMVVNVRVRVFGSTSTQDLESDPLDFPVYVCSGCLVANVLTCPFTVEPSNPGNPCNVSQDNYVDCCSLNNELICPPIVAGVQ